MDGGFFVGVLVVAAICGFLSSAIANDQKGLWFAVGFFLGPLGVLITAIAGRK